MTERLGGWLQTYTKQVFWPLDARPEEIQIKDIAHALSNQCRFAGHVDRFYSVAEHSVRVSYTCDCKDALWGLLHDASEAYLVDLPRPIKNYSEIGRLYREAERKLMTAVCQRFGLEVNEPESVDQADKIMLGIEARDLMSPLLPGWEKWLALIKGPPRCVGKTMMPVEAKAAFMARFMELTERDGLPRAREAFPPAAGKVEQCEVHA